MPSTADPVTDARRRAALLAGALALAALCPAHAAPRREALTTDRAAYRPGEIIRYRHWGDGHPVELVDARGVSVATAQGAGRIVVPEDLGEGHYRLRAKTPWHVFERAITVDAGDPPPLRITARFDRASHDPGAPVRAAVRVTGPDGGPVRGGSLEATLVVDGAVAGTHRARTDDEGRAELPFALPAERAAAARIDARVVDGAIAAGATIPIPLTPEAPVMRFVPEGGSAVVGLTSRVYVAARGPEGPAEFAGRVVDDRGEAVAEVTSAIDGRARFEWTPRPGRSYRFEGRDGRSTPLPPPEPGGCVMRVVDDFADERPTIGVDLRCTRAEDVRLSAHRFTEPFATADARVDVGAATRVELETDRRRGPVVLTLTRPDASPLAQRAVFRHRARAHRVTIEPDRAVAAPGETLRFTVRVADADGAPVAGDLALAVLDAGAEADDPGPDVVAQALLLPIAGPIERADRYLAPGEAAGRAMDLLMGAAPPDGWSSMPIAGPVGDGTLGPPPPWAAPDGVQVARPAHLPPLPTPPPRLVYRRERVEIRDQIFFPAGSTSIQPRSEEVLDAVARIIEANDEIVRVTIEGHSDDRGSSAAGLEASRARAEAVRWALVARGIAPGRLLTRGHGSALPIDDNRTAQGRAANRRVEFDLQLADPRAPPDEAPDDAPETNGALDGVDFHRTVAWIPALQVEGGAARVEVQLPDAVTRVRVIAHGMAGEGVARGEAVVRLRPSALALRADPPRRVVRGDRVSMPITVSNHTGARISPTLRWISVGRGPAASRRLDPLEPGGARRIDIPFDSGEAGSGALMFWVEGGRHVARVIAPFVIVERSFAQARPAEFDLAPDATVKLDMPLPADASGAELEAALSPTVYTSLLAAVERGLAEPDSPRFSSLAERLWVDALALRSLEHHAAAGRRVDPAALARARRFVDLGVERVLAMRLPSGGIPVSDTDPGAYPITAALAIILLHDAGAGHRAGPTADWLAARLAAHPITTAIGARPARIVGKPYPLTDEDTSYAYDLQRVWIEWALVVAGRPIDLLPLEGEIARDPYAVAVRILTLVAAGRAVEGRALAEQLLAQRPRSGRWRGRRWRVDRTDKPTLGFETETTALVVRALHALGVAPDAQAQGIAALLAERHPAGLWPAAEATTQALAALLTAPPAPDVDPGRLDVALDGRPVWHSAVSALGIGQANIPLPTEGLTPSSSLTFTQTGGVPVKGSVALRWHAETVAPPAPPGLTLRAALDRETMAVGQTATLTATLTADAPRSDVVLRIGVPAGLRLDPAQLRAWVARGHAARAEVRWGEVVVHVGDLEAGGTRTFTLVAVAGRPGRWRGVASSAYARATRHAAWAPAVPVTIE